MKRRLLLMLVALVLAMSAFPLTARADNVCNTGEFCAWGDPNYGGDFWDPSTDDPNWNFFGIENDDDAVKNFESVKVYVYPNSSYGGSLLYCTAPGEIEDDIADARDNDGDSNLTFDSTGSTSCGTLPRP